MTAYQPRYEAAVREFDDWDDLSKDWGPEHDRMLEEVAVKHGVFGALMEGTRFESRKVGSAVRLSRRGRA